MSYLHCITHPVEIVQRKVNFFADCFVYISENREILYYLHYDTPLNLIDKLIYQLDYNFEHCQDYILSIISHPIFDNQEQFLEDYTNFGKVKESFNSIQQLNRNKIKSWIIVNPVFKKNLLSLRNELKKKLFKNTVASVIELLANSEFDDQFENAITYYSSVLVNELLESGRDPVFLSKIFQKIIKPNDKIGFVNQIRRFLRIRTEKHTTSYFIFKIDGLELMDGGEFKYHQVQFCNSNDPKFDSIRQNLKNGYELMQFFKEESVLAYINIKHISKVVAEKQAIKQIKKEIIFLNNRLNSNITLRPFHYLHTPSFSSCVGFQWRRGQDYKLQKYELEKLESTVFNKLTTSNINFQTHFLRNEFLFDYAKNTEGPQDYFHYLEVLLKPVINAKLHVVELVSRILLTKYKEDSVWINNRNLLNILINNRDVLKNDHNMTQFYVDAFKKGDLPLDEIETRYNHDFINQIIKVTRELSYATDWKFGFATFQRVFYDLKAQRNAIVHDGMVDSNCSNSLLPITSNMINRFRNIIIEQALERPNQDFITVIESLLEKSYTLVRN